MRWRAGVLVLTSTSQMREAGGGARTLPEGFAAERGIGRSVGAVGIPAFGGGGDVMRLSVAVEAVEIHGHGHGEAEVEQSAFIGEHGIEPGNEFGAEEGDEGERGVFGIGEGSADGGKLLRRDVHAFGCATVEGVGGKIGEFFGGWEGVGIEFAAQGGEGDLADGATDEDGNRRGREVFLKKAATPLFGAALEHDELGCGKIIGHEKPP